MAVISEKCVWFASKVEYWQSLAAPLRTTLDDGVAPSPGDEIMLYQILLGTWPLSLMDPAAINPETINGYLERMLRWQEKALREAKLRTSWSAPNTAYETASREFLTRLLTDDDTQTLRDDILSAATSIAPAGALNGLSQTLLRMTTPGVPDLYQGCEFWDFSLVDPDNRQPVDFGARVAALSSNMNLDSAAQSTGNDLVTHWQDGHIKQWLIANTLRTREQYPLLFAEGDYQALSVEGEYADQLVAFVRHHENTFLIVIAPRICANLLGDSSTPFINPSAWGDTRVSLPAGSNISKPLSTLAPVSHNTQDQNTVLVSELLANTPVNFLVLEATALKATAFKALGSQDARSNKSQSFNEVSSGEVSHEH